MTVSSHTRKIKIQNMRFARFMRLIPCNAPLNQPPESQVEESPGLATEKGQ
jgi:hypothetical protein